MAGKQSIDYGKDADFLTRLEEIGPSRMAAELGCSKGAIDGHRRKLLAGGTNAVTAVSTEEEAGRTDLPDGSVTIISTADGQALTPEDLLELHGISLDEYVVARARPNAWNAMTSDKKTGDNRVVTMHQLRLDLLPKTALIAIPDPANWRPPAKPKATRKTRDPLTTVVCGDHHAPFEDRELHAAFLQYLAEERPDFGVVNGDLLDFHTISRHRDREGFAMPVNACLSAAFNILMDYRQASPDTRWTIKRGNHDQRLYDLIVDNVRGLHRIQAADDEVPALSLRRLLHLDELGIDLIDQDWDMAKVRLSRKLSVRHGPSTSKNAGKALLDKFSVSIIQNHTHRLSLAFRTEHSDEEEEPHTTRLAAEAGCMCQIKDGLGYADSPDWHQGFLLARVWPDGDFHIQPGVYVPGRLLAPNGNRYTA